MAYRRLNWSETLPCLLIRGGWKLEVLGTYTEKGKQQQILQYHISEGGKPDEQVACSVSYADTVSLLLLKEEIQEQTS